VFRKSSCNELYWVHPGEKMSREDLYIVLICFTAVSPVITCIFLDMWLYVDVNSDRGYFNLGPNFCFTSLYILVSLRWYAFRVISELGS
jgi:hypothetical protein